MMRPPKTNPSALTGLGYKKSESIKTITKDGNAEKVIREIKQYSVDDHIKPQWDKIKAIYNLFSERILELDPRFEINPRKIYIGFKIEGNNVVNVKPQSTKIVLDLLRVQPKDLNDPEKRTKYMNHSYDWYRQHVTQFNIKNEEDVEYAFILSKQINKLFI